MELLPPEIKQHLVQFLDLRSKRMMRLANYQWFNAINYDNYIFYFLKRESTREVVDRLSKYPWPIHLTLRKSLTAFLPSMSYEFIKFINLESLEIDEINYYMKIELEEEEEENLYKWQSLSLLTNLKKLSIKGDLSNGLRRSIRQIPNLTLLEITLDGYSRSINDNHNFYSMTKLLELSLRLINDYSMPLTVCPTNLTKLYLLYDPDPISCLDVDLSGYTQLKTLEFILGSVFKGEIKVLDLPTSLQSIYLKGNKITNSNRSLHRCKNLTKLCLMSSDNIDTNIIADHVLTQLRVFGLSKIQPSIATNRLLSYLPQELEQIYIEGVDISSILHLASSVQRMSIHPATDLKLISQFSNLTHLTISKKYNETLEEVQQLTKLKSLIVKSKSKLDPAALTNLDYLWLNSSNDMERYYTLSHLTFLRCDMDTIDSKLSDMTRMTNAVKYFFILCHSDVKKYNILKVMGLYRPIIK